MDYEKQIRWVGSAYHDLRAFPKDARKEAGFQLGKIQAGLEPADLEAVRRCGCLYQRDSHPGREWHLPRDVCRQVRGSRLCTALLPEENSGDQQAGQGNCRRALSCCGQRVAMCEVVRSESSAVPLAAVKITSHAFHFTGD